MCAIIFCGAFGRKIKPFNITHKLVYSYRCVYKDDVCPPCVSLKGSSEVDLVEILFEYVCLFVLSVYMLTLCVLCALRVSAYRE